MTDDPSTWLTPQAYRKLQEEFEHLTTVGRHEIEERIAEARSHGDLRENAEYDVAKHDQGLMEARIRTVRHLLDHAVVREAADDGAVDVGTVATVVDEDGDEMDFLVAGAENKVAGLLLATPDSPLGAALLGTRPGEAITYEAPGGTFSYTVKAVRVYEG